MVERGTGRESDKFMLRLPDGMRDRIKAEADRNGRSMNAEIIAALHEKYPPPSDPDLDKMDEMVMKFAPDEFGKFLRDLLDREILEGRITEDQLRDGLIPGVKLKRQPE